jgi:hypothetical protein
MTLESLKPVPPETQDAFSMPLTWIPVSLALNASDQTTGDRAKLTIERGAVVRGPRNARRLALVFTADPFAKGAGTIPAGREL